MLAAAIVLCFSVPALAATKGFYVIQDKDRQCRVVDLPSDTSIKRLGTRVGREVYGTREEAEAVMGALCRAF